MARRTGDDADETEVLEAFSRVDKKNGKPTQWRITTNVHFGKRYTHFRLYYRASHPSPDDDGFRPSPIGIAFKSRDEVSRAIAALMDAERITPHELPEPAAPPRRRNRRPPRRWEVLKLRRYADPVPWDDGDDAAFLARTFTAREVHVIQAIREFDRAKAEGRPLPFDAELMERDEAEEDSWEVDDGLHEGGVEGRGVGDPDRGDPEG